MTNSSRQSEVEIKAIDEVEPSLLLYAILIFASFCLIAYAFHLQPVADWAGLMLNLGAGFIGAVIVLVVVDRRLRASEVASLMRIPAKAGLRLRSTFMPTHRVAFSYSRALITTLEPTLENIVRLPGYERLDAEAESGMILLGSPGTGKTTWTHLFAVDTAHRYLAGESGAHIVLLLPLARWRGNQDIGQSLYDVLYRSAPCPKWAYRRLLEMGVITVVADGYDELWDRESSFMSQYSAFKAAHPKVNWILTTRETTNLPAGFGGLVRMPIPDPETLTAIRTRVRKMMDEAPLY